MGTNMFDTNINHYDMKVVSHLRFYNRHNPSCLAGSRVSDEEGFLCNIVQGESEKGFTHFWQ